MSEEHDDSVWKRLTKLFRSGPVVRHKIASGEKLQEPQGTARAYKRELSNLYVNSMASYGQYERLARYGDYAEMEHSPEIASALNIFADETTCADENGNILKITSPSETIKELLETLFFDVLNIEFNAWSWARNLCKTGDYILFVDASEQTGILNLLPIPINEIEREEGYDKNDPFAVRFRWLTQGNMILQNWQVIHFRLLGNDMFLPYGQSIIEPARRIWRQLILIEDAMLVYRIVRSPERRVFKIPVGNIPPNEVDAFMESVTTKLKRNTIVDSNTGRVDLRYNPLSVEEDYFLPFRGDQGPEISTLAGGQFTGDIEDVQYIQGKLFAALQVPKAYLGYEEQLGCLRISTTLPLLDGSSVSIEELLARQNAGAETWLYSSKSDGTVTPGKVKKVWPTKSVSKITHVTLDNGESVDVTENHPFMLRDGSYKRADELCVGDSLMPLYQRVSSRSTGDSINVSSIEVLELDVPELVYDIEVDNEEHNFALSCGVFVHNSKSTLSQMDVRFAKTIERVQKIFVSELKKIAIIHLYLLGYRGENLVNFNIEMANPSTIAEQQNLELWRMRFEVSGMAQEGTFDRTTIYKEIFKRNPKEIALIKEGKLLDALEDAALERAKTSAPADAGGGEATDTGEAVPGEEALPDTLGGESPAPETTPEGFEAEGKIVERNPGSEGDDAFLAVDKGRDLFSTGDDSYEIVFGTEKQTASDPFDKAAMKRIITRPFGENTENDAAKNWINENIENTSKIADAVKNGLSELLRREEKKIRMSAGRARQK